MDIPVWKGDIHMRITSTHNQNQIQVFSHTKQMENRVDISNKMEKTVIVQISSEGKRAISLKDKNEFSSEIIEVNKRVDYLPKYSGIYSADKTIATAVENCSKEEQAFVYDTIRQNFLVENTCGMTEVERQANISLGMKKAEYAAQNFISDDNKEIFLEAMETVAMLAAAGKVGKDGIVEYGIKRDNYLGYGSNLVYTTDALDVMKTMDGDAYVEYKRISQDSSNQDRALDALKYLTNWYNDAVTKNPHLLDKYQEKTDEYMNEVVKKQKLDTTFESINIESIGKFIESLRQFQVQNPIFLFEQIQKELSMFFWKK